MAFDINKILQEFVETGATDCYLTVGAPPSLRFGHRIEAYNAPQLTEEDMQAVLAELFTPEVIEEFEATLEYNTALVWREARFRVNLFRQRKYTGMVMRRIRTDIPTLKQMNLPKIYGDMILEKRGLVLVVGPTGAGKSTSLAAMLGHRNTYGHGHVVTVEDPIEFVHEHNKCLFTQRDVGIDTYSFGIGLKNMLRQTPDVIVIGEIRDRETMEHAITFAETGHLCLATLHSNNTNQAIERILNFFPEEKHKQVLLNLSFNIKAILSQRLVANHQGERSLALEVMLNQGVIKGLIHDGRIKEIREHIEKGRDMGMLTFDQSLFDLYVQGDITEETALGESDNPANLRLLIKQHNMGKSIDHAKAASRGFGTLDASGKPQF